MGKVVGGRERQREGRGRGGDREEGEFSTRASDAAWEDSEREEGGRETGEIGE
jgi:hypothetical protein